MTATLAPVLPLHPRATRVRKPNRRPSSVPADTGLAAIAADLVRLGGRPADLPGLPGLDPVAAAELARLMTSRPAALAR